MSLEDWLSWVLLVGGALTVVGVLSRWFWRIGKLVVRQFAMVSYVTQEMNFNGGSSMRDAQWRTEQIVRIIVEHLGIELPAHLQRPSLPPPESNDRTRQYLHDMAAPDPSHRINQEGS